MKTLNVKGFIGFIAAAGLAIMMAACSGSVDSGKGGNSSNAAFCPRCHGF